MTDLETTTELFDLFGETGTCSICQEDLVEGERIRAVKSCQHSFHATCVDPWLTTKGTCPMCRTSLRGEENTNEIIAEANQSIQAIFSTLQNTIRDLPDISVRTPRVQNILERIESILQQAPVPASAPPAPVPVPAPEPVTEERYILSYCLAHGIWRRFRTAALFEPHRQAIRTSLEGFTLDGVRPAPIDTMTFAALSRSRDSYRDEFIQHSAYTTRTYTSAPQIRTMTNRLRQLQDAGNNFLVDYWRSA